MSLDGALHSLLPRAFREDPLVLGPGNDDFRRRRRRHTVDVLSFCRRGGRAGLRRRGRRRLHRRRPRRRLRRRPCGSSLHRKKVSCGVSAVSLSRFAADSAGFTPVTLLARGSGQVGSDINGEARKQQAVRPRKPEK